MQITVSEILNRKIQLEAGQCVEPLEVLIDSQHGKVLGLRSREGFLSALQIVPK